MTNAFRFRILFLVLTFILTGCFGGSYFFRDNRNCLENPYSYNDHPTDWQNWERIYWAKSCTRYDMELNYYAQNGGGYNPQIPHGYNHGGLYNIPPKPVYPYPHAGGFNEESEYDDSNPLFKIY